MHTWVVDTMGTENKRKRSADLNKIYHRLEDLGIDSKDHHLFIGKESEFAKMLELLKDFSDCRSASNSKFSAKIIPESLRDEVAVLASSYGTSISLDNNNQDQFNHIKMRLLEIFKNFPPLYLYLYLLRTPISSRSREYIEWFFYLFSLVLMTNGNIQTLIFYFNFKGNGSKLPNSLKDVFNDFEVLFKRFLNEWLSGKFPKTIKSFGEQLSEVYTDDQMKFYAIENAILEKLIYIFRISYFNTNLYKINIMKFVGELDEFLSTIKITAKNINLPGSGLEIKLSAACSVHSRLFLHDQFKEHFPDFDYSDWAILDQEFFAIGAESLLSVLLKHQSRIRLIGVELGRMHLTGKIERLMAIKSLMNNSALLVDRIKGDAENVSNLIDNFTFKELNVMLDIGCLDVLLVISNSKDYFRNAVMPHFNNKDFVQSCKNVAKLKKIFQLFSAVQYKNVYGLDFMLFHKLFEQLMFGYPYVNVYRIISSKECTAENKRALASSLVEYSLVGNRDSMQFLENFCQIFPEQTKYLKEPAPFIQYSKGSINFTDEMLIEWENMQSNSYTRLLPNVAEIEKSNLETGMENVQETSSQVENKK